MGFLPLPLSFFFILGYEVNDFAVPCIPCHDVLVGSAEPTD
jgi:hypothetical protein